VLEHTLLGLFLLSFLALEVGARPWLLELALVLHDEGEVGLALELAGLLFEGRGPEGLWLVRSWARDGLGTAVDLVQVVAPGRLLDGGGFDGPRVVDVAGLVAGDAVLALLQDIFL
jgi:hypothetical protein